MTSSTNSDESNGNHVGAGSIHMPPAMTVEAVNDQMAVMISLTMVSMSHAAVVSMCIDGLPDF